MDEPRPDTMQRMEAAASASSRSPMQTGTGASGAQAPRSTTEGHATEAGDLALVRAAIGGAADATERLFARLRCVARMLAGRNAQLGRPLSEHELEDLLQETLLALWQKLDEYDGRVRLESWAFGFALLQLLDRLRRLDRFEGLLARAPAPDPSVVDAAPAHADELERVHRALAMLERVDADVVRSKHFDELSFEEIAARFGEPTSTIKTRYYRAVARLRFQLRSWTDAGPAESGGLGREGARP
jgi:RNA polymerase sigma-70 factor (ECF subfamily)